MVMLPEESWEVLGNTEREEGNGAGRREQTPVIPREGGRQRRLVVLGENSAEFHLEW